jgi:hypothetical protein
MHLSRKRRASAAKPNFGSSFPIAVAVLLALSACGEETPREASGPPPSANVVAPHAEKWLDVENPLTPAQWLASRGEAQARSISDAKVLEVDANLEAAHRLYRESERMIANRAAQLSDMLKASGVAEDADDVLADLAGLAGEIGQTEGFGAVAQMYHNLRSSGVDRTAALAALKTRYGPRGAAPE